MKTVLACVDFSELERSVIDAGEALARMSGGALHVLHVAEPDPDFVGYGAGPQTVRDTVAATIRGEHRRVESLVEQIGQRGVLAYAHLLRGPYADTILHEAERLGADVIVIGSHAHGRLHDMFVGSVAARVLRGAKVPVMVVPPRQR